MDCKHLVSTCSLLGKQKTFVPISEITKWRSQTKHLNNLLLTAHINSEKQRLSDFEFFLESKENFCILKVNTITPSFI